MKKIIDRIVYDTEKAEQIAFYSSNYNPGDFEYFEERLYQTKKGNWFLHGEGGPASPYCETFGNSTSGSEEIVPMDEDEVIEWCERRQLITVLMERFPEAIEEA
jgi:hypothetical protein